MHRSYSQLWVLGLKFNSRRFGHSFRFGQALYVALESLRQLLKFHAQPGAASALRLPRLRAWGRCPGYAHAHLGPNFSHAKLEVFGACACSVLGCLSAVFA